VTIQLDGYDLAGNLERGAYIQTTLYAGSANSNTVTLQVCGDSASGC